MKKLSTLIITILFLSFITQTAQAQNYKQLTYSFYSHETKTIYLNPNFSTLVRFPVPIKTYNIANSKIVVSQPTDPDKLLLIPFTYEGKTNVLVIINSDYQMSINLEVTQDEKKGNRIVDIMVPDPNIDDLKKTSNITPVQPVIQPASTTIVYMEKPEPKTIPPLHIDIAKTETKNGMKTTINYIEENPDGFVIDMTVVAVNNKPFIANMKGISVVDEYNAPHNILKTINVNNPVFGQNRNWQIFVKGVRPRMMTVTVPNESDNSMLVQIIFPGQQ